MSVSDQINIAAKKQRRAASEQDSIFALLECTVCLEGPMLPPIRQCINGHVLCDLCSGKPACSTCPQCRASPTNGRCLVLEKMAESIVIPCKNVDCPIELAYGSMADHMQNCEYNPIMCPVSACKTLPMTREAITKHLIDEHLVSVADMMEYDMLRRIVHSVSLPQDPPRIERQRYLLLQAQDTAFLLRFGYSFDQYYCFVQCIGTKSRSNNFNCTISVANGRRVMSWKGPVRSVAESLDVVRDSDDCFRVKESLARKLAREGRSSGSLILDLEVEIEPDGYS